MHIAGAVDVAVQALDRNGGGSLDLALAADLGRALAAKVDEQLVAGTNASGQTIHRSRSHSADWLHYAEYATRAAALGVASGPGSEAQSGLSRVVGGSSCS